MESTAYLSAGLRGRSLNLPTVQGDKVLKNDSSTLSNVHIAGSLYILATNITVDNVKVDGDIYVNADPSGNLLSPVPANIVIRHVESQGIFTQGFNGLTLDAVNFHDQLNGPQGQLYDAYYAPKKEVFPASNLVVENSWFHGFRTSTNSAHLANLHIGGVHGVVIKNNRFELNVDPTTWARTSVTANLEFASPSETGTGAFSSNVTIENNSFYGVAYYQLYMEATGTSYVIDNRFHSNPLHWAGVQFFNYTPAGLPPGGYVKFHQSGNTLDGQPVKLPGGY